MLKEEMPHLNLYMAYGLCICSEVSLPELQEVRKRADVEIKVGKLDNLFQSAANDKREFWVTDSKVFCSYSNIGSFLINEGREIIVDPAPCIDAQLLRASLLEIISILLFQRGLLILHGSAILLEGGAVVFLGPSGSGKSTAAASLAIKGCPIVADDIIAIETRDEVPIVYPAYPQLNLLPVTADSLGLDLNTLPQVSPMNNKRAARFDLCFSSKPVPLKKIYMLERYESTGIQKLGPQESTIKLIRSSYHSGSLISGASQLSHFLQCTKIAKKVPICNLMRPFDLKAMTNFAEMILEIDAIR